MMMLLTVLFFFFFTAIAWRRLDWAMMIIVFALPSYLIRFNIMGLPFTLLEGMILIAFTVWFLKSWPTVFLGLRAKIRGMKELGRENYPFGLEIILLLIVAFIAAGVAGFSRESLGIFKAYFFEPALFFILLFNTLGREALEDIKSRWPEKILWPLAISGLAVSLLAVYQKFTGNLIDNPLWQAEGTRRVVSFFGYPNAVGLYLGPLILLFTGWLAKEFSEVKQGSNRIFNFHFSIFNSKIFKIFFIAFVIAISLLAIYFAKSRGAIIGVAAGIFVFGLLAGKKVRLITLGLGLILAAGIYFYPPAKEIAAEKIALRDLSGEIRKQQWRETWAMLSDGRLISGAGLSGYQAAVAPYHQEGIFFNKLKNPDFHRKTVFDAAYRKLVWQPVEIYMYPHNIFLNFWSELGLAGMLLFIFIIGKYFVVVILNLKRKSDGLKYKYLNIGLIGAMAVIVVHGLVDVPYFKNDLSVMFWIFIFMVSLINLKHKSALSGAGQENV
ncbi:MAG: O-antigen ligase family protein [Patescibacteria group bacterium]|jgi:O-antigen ligase